MHGPSSHMNCGSPSPMALRSYLSSLARLLSSSPSLFNFKVLNKFEKLNFINNN